MRTACAIVAVAMGPALVACRTEQTIVTPDPHLERMLEQPKVLPYGEAPLLPGGTAMQHPPEGTLSSDTVVGDPAEITGASNGRWADRIPIAVDRDLVETGRHRFEEFCAACHGILGNGVSAVAEKMSLRRPPSLEEDRIRAYPPGQIFQTIREGYGLMPSYAVQLSVDETWAVVSYVRALQLSRAAPVSELPPDLKSELAREAP